MLGCSRVQLSTAPSWPYLRRSTSSTLPVLKGASPGPGCSSLWKQQSKPVTSQGFLLPCWQPLQGYPSCSPTLLLPCLRPSACWPHHQVGMHIVRVSSVPTMCRHSLMIVLCALQGALHLPISSSWGHTASMMVRA